MANIIEPIGEPIGVDETVARLRRALASAEADLQRVAVKLAKSEEALRLVTENRDHWRDLYGREIPLADELVAAQGQISELKQKLEEARRLAEFAEENEASIAKTLAHLQGETSAPIPMRLPCEDCGELHVDEGDFVTKSHHTHACQFCGLVWRPAKVATVGVRFLPGYRNEVDHG